MQTGLGQFSAAVFKNTLWFSKTSGGFSDKLGFLVHQFLARLVSG